MISLSYRQFCVAVGVASLALSMFAAGIAFGIWYAGLRVPNMSATNAHTCSGVRRET